MTDAIKGAYPITDPRHFDFEGDLFSYQVFDNEPVAGAAAIIESILAGPNFSPPKIGNGLQISRHARFGFWIGCTGGTINVTLHLLQSKDDVAANYAIPAGAGIDPNLAITTNAAQVGLITPVPLPFMRFRLNAGGANSADVRCSLYVWGQTP
jgi:hypothetical protein